MPRYKNRETIVRAIVQSPFVLPGSTNVKTGRCRPGQSIEITMKLAKSLGNLVKITDVVKGTEPEIPNEVLPEGLDIETR